jgi:TusA-related sulfurtransferase
MLQYQGFRWLARLLQPRWTAATVRFQPAARLVDIPGHGRALAQCCLDFTAQTCVRTNLGAQRALEALAVGQIAEIVSDNLSAVETIPFMLDGLGCEHLGTIQLDGLWKIYARRCRP